MVESKKFLIGLSISFIHGLIISKIYLKTYSGFSFDKTFSFTLILLTVIVSLVMMVISTNIALSLGLLGSLSIIRFRTVVKDTKDTAYIFWALAVGMASGTGSYFLALAGTAMISVIALILHQTNFGSFIKSEFILQFVLQSK